MRSLRPWFVYLFPLVAPWVILFAVNAGAGVPLRTQIPRERFTPSQCNWDCHNHGCKHASRLPPSLTGDQGLFGRSIAALYRLGALLSPHRGAGYAAANLLVFCVVWPAIMYGLWILVWRQQDELRRRRKP
jgi:hypothetical protein